VMVGVFWVPTSIRRVECPAARIAAATNACSGPLVSNVPSTAIVLGVVGFWSRSDMESHPFVKDGLADRVLESLWGGSKLNIHVRLPVTFSFSRTLIDSCAHFPAAHFTAFVSSVLNAG
jgi:hypothetical protein